MKKLLESIDKLTECPPDSAMASAPVNPGNPVTVSVNFNASGKENVEDLLAMMKNAGLGGAEPVTPQMMPMRQDMDRLRAIVSQPEMEADSAYSDAIEDDLDLEEWDNEPDPEYQDAKYMTKDLAGGINREKRQFKPAAKGDNPMAVEEGRLSPNFLKALDLKFGSKPNLSSKTEINLRKEMVKFGPNELMQLSKANIPHVSDAAQHELNNRRGRGLKGYDENMAETIKKNLMAALQEKKAKPDFLDMDKDGNKKEPMKKAIADKKKNPFAKK